MSGLDPAAIITRQLVELLLERRGTVAQQQRISFDDFMKVCVRGGGGYIPGLHVRGMEVEGGSSISAALMT